jgi:serine phosphatase RsbU (regulator of sigma subunit)/CHASE2 domain-containing sensor protein
MTAWKSRSDDLGELDAWARLRVRASGLLAALLVVVALVAFQDPLRQPLFDLYQRLGPSPKPSPGIAVVVVDAPSLAAVGGWPWPRYTLARLTEKITEQGPRAIGFDFLFPEADRETPAAFAAQYPELSAAAAAEVRALPATDAIFGAAIGRSPVVMARVGFGADSYDRLDAPPALPPEAQFTGPQPAAIPHYRGAVANYAMLDGRALGHGLVNGPPDADGLIRRVPLLGRVGDVLTPGFALDLVRVAEDVDTIALKGSPRALEAIQVGGRRVSVDAGGRVALRFAARHDAHGRQLAAYPTYSAANILRRGFDPGAFKDRIVLVGLTAAGTSDVVATPRDKEAYGVFVQAQAVDAILRDGGLRRPLWAPLSEWWIAVALVLVSYMGVPRADMGLVIVGAVFETAAAFAASFAAFQHDILLDPIPMLAPGAANSALTVALLFVEGRRVQARLRSALDEERLGAARMSGELAAASEIQAGMLLPRSELARICPAVEIDAVLQPARTVGGDLYDAFMLDAERLCFLVGDVTGKGVPASLFMALSKALSRSQLTRRRTDLNTAVEGINAELSRNNSQAMAVSLLVGVLRLDDGRLDLCSAGHEHPLVADAGGVVRELKLEGGPPLCVVDDFPYPVETHYLRPGETLVAFTDGLTEAQDPEGRFFSREQVFAAVAEAAAAERLTDAVDGLVARVRAFEAGGEPSDDLTILALRRRRDGASAG